MTTRTLKDRNRYDIRVSFHRCFSILYQIVGARPNLSRRNNRHPSGVKVLLEIERYHQAAWASPESVRRFSFHKISLEEARKPIVYQTTLGCQAAGTVEFPGFSDTFVPELPANEQAAEASNAIE
jgi:hypothetical protein